MIYKTLTITTSLVVFLAAAPCQGRNYLMSVSPSSGAGPGGHFEITATHPLGSQAIQNIYGLFGSYPSNWNACSWMYVPSRGTLGLQADVPEIYAGDLAPGTNDVIENSYCQISALSVSANSTGYTLSMNVSFKVPWANSVLNLWVGLSDGQPLEWEIYTQWRVAAALPIVGPSSPPEEIKGVQAVLLHCWDRTSRLSFIEALNKATPRKIAISSAPYLTDRCTMAPGQTNRLATLNAVLNSLTGKDEIHVILFAGDFQKPQAPASLASNFKKIWNEIICPTENGSPAGRCVDLRFYFHIAGDLEDHYSNGAVDPNFIAMANALDTKQMETLNSLINQGRFTFHRSPDPNFNTGNGENRSAGVNNYPITHEFHGQKPFSGTILVDFKNEPQYTFYSNDGPFVYYNRTGKREECLNNCGLPDQSKFQPFSLTDFKSRSFPSYSGKVFRLLWRPAYNLLPYEPSESGGVKTRKFKKLLTVRADGADSGFDDWEEEVLLQFMK